GLVLRGELVGRLGAGGGDAEQRRAELLERLPVVAEAAGFLRAAGRVVLRIEVQHDVLPLEVRERDLRAAAVRERERGCRLAFRQCGHGGFLAERRLPAQRRAAKPSMVEAEGRPSIENESAGGHDRRFDHHHGDALIVLLDVLARRVAETGGRTFLVHEGRRVSWAEFDGLSNRVAHGLRARGVGKGDRVTLALGNSVEYVATAFGVLKAGAV